MVTVWITVSLCVEVSSAANPKVDQWMMREAEKRRAPMFAAASVDVGAAAAASLMVSPFIYTIDKAIVESAAGGTTLLRAFVTNAAQILR